MKRTAHLIAILILMALAGNALAAGFLKIGDIKGESTDQAHKDWIVIESWSFGESRPGTAAATTGKRQHAPFKVTKAVDKSSPMLQRAAQTGQTFERVYLDAAETGADGRETYLKYELENVMITSYSLSSGGDRPMESFALNYKAIKTDTVPYRPARRTEKPEVQPE